MEKPWLIAGNRAQMGAGSRLRALMEKPGLLKVPGAHDALTGRLALQAGFEALYVSGAAVSASMALPDLGLITQEELVQTTRQIARATQVPLIVDGDTGYGEALNVMRLVVELEDAGAAAVQIEDQILPKKCGHLNDKQLLPADMMARKIEAACRARADLLVVARTDAAETSLDEAISRARLYADAGADIIFPEALTSDADFGQVCKAVDVPVLANMTEFGRTPYRSADQLAALGCGIAIWPVSSLRVAMKAAEDLYAHLASTGETHSQTAKMQTRAELYEAIGYHDYEALDATIARSVLPQRSE